MKFWVGITGLNEPYWGPWSIKIIAKYIQFTDHILSPPIIFLELCIALHGQRSHLRPDQLQTNVGSTLSKRNNNKNNNHNDNNKFLLFTLASTVRLRQYGC